MIATPGPAWLVASWMAIALLGGCGEASRLPDAADVGPKPTLGAPRSGVLPTVHVAQAVGWSEGRTPLAASGLQVSAYAQGLDHPRWLHVLPNGDVLVAETNAPERPDDAKGLKGWAMKRVQAYAGAGVPSANRITLLRGVKADGTALTRSVFLDGLHSPFGMVLVGDRFYVANTDAVWEYPYTAGQLSIAGPGTKLTDLPAGPVNHHWTKNLIASPDGTRLYASVGSNSNVAEKGMAAEEGRAAIWEIDRASGRKRLFATGLRNANGMAWLQGPDGGPPVLWTVVNERDELGSDLVPDYLTSVRDGGFYGWPYSWYGNHVDERVSPQKADLVAKALVPDYALGAHVAALGLAAQGPSSGVYIGQHGSWNRRPFAGYRVVFVPFANGQPKGLPVEVLGGFVDASGQAMGRPVGVVLDARGDLLVADDVGNTVWRVVRRSGN